jgi:hypothetical protein
LKTKHACKNELLLSLQENKHPFDEVFKNREKTVLYMPEMQYRSAKEVLRYKTRKDKHIPSSLQVD